MKLKTELNANGMLLVIFYSASLENNVACTWKVTTWINADPVLFRFH